MPLSCGRLKAGALPPFQDPFCNNPAGVQYVLTFLVHLIRVSVAHISPKLPHNKLHLQNCSALINQCIWSTFLSCNCILLLELTEKSAKCLSCFFLFHLGACRCAPFGPVLVNAVILTAVLLVHTMKICSIPAICYFFPPFSLEVKKKWGKA